MQEFNVIIGTSGAGGELPLAKGLPLFPKLGTSRAGTSASTQYDELYDIGTTVLFWRLRTSAYYEFFMGLVGPAVAFRFGSDVTLTNVGSGGTLTVDMPDQEMLAGLEMGLSVGGGVSVKQDLYLPSSWYSPWKFQWKTVLDLTVGFEIDLLGLFFELISYLLDQGAADGLWEEDTAQPLSGLLGSVSTFNMTGWSNDELGPDRSLTTTAGFTLPVDLVDAIPILGTFAKALEAIKGDLSFGPAIGFGIPVDLGLQSFTVEGGQGPGSKADYGSLTYTDSGVVATGPPFTGTATKLTTNVNYTSSFTILLSCHFSLSVCKLFNLDFTVPSLDLLNLLGLPRPPLASVTDSVSTDLKSGCVLIPQMTITFTPANGKPGDPIRAGVAFLTEILLSETWQDNSTPVQITIGPAAPDFPPFQLTFEKGNQSAAFVYTFPNQCLLTGDPDDPNSTAAATPITPYKTYSVSASLPTQSSHPCDVYEVTGALRVLLNVIYVKFLNGVLGDAPDWNPAGGAQLNGDITQPPTDVPNYVDCEYAFNYASGQTPGSATVKFALYDDRRLAHSTSNVRITFQSGGSATISANDPTPVVCQCAHAADFGPGEFPSRVAFAGTSRQLPDPVLPDDRCRMFVRPDRVLAQCLELVVTANTEAAEVLQIRTAAQLFGALASADTATRLTAVKAIQRQPKAALQFGLFEGRDVIDALLLHSRRIEGTLEWMDWIGALAGFFDGRVAQFFWNVFRSYGEPLIVFAAMRYLSAEGVRPAPAALAPLLLQNECPVRARAAAELLTHSDQLSPAARVRVGLLASEGESVAISTETASAWIAELKGPFRAEAMADLEAQQLPAWIELSKNWDKLDANDQVWLLAWGRRDCQQSVGAVLEAALSSNHTRVMQAAFETLSDPPISELYGSLSRFAVQAVTHADPQIRCAAVAANPLGVDWRRMLATEEDPSVRRACLTALRKREAEKALPDLVESLRDQDWRTRAVAATELVALGTPAIHAVRPLVHDSQEYVRIAAAGILADLEDFAWLERELLSGISESSS